MRLHTEITSPFNTRLVIEMLSNEDEGSYECQAGPFSTSLIIDIPGKLDHVIYLFIYFTGNKYN